MWKNLSYPSKRNLASVVLRAQSNAKQKQEEPEDSKTRRRRLYKILSDERPVFPVQGKNFYTMVMDNKEIIKLLGMLSTCTMELRQVSNNNTRIDIHLSNRIDSYVEFTGFDGISRSLEALQVSVEERTQYARIVTNLFVRIRKYSPQAQRTRGSIGHRTRYDHIRHIDRSINGKTEVRCLYGNQR